MTSPRAVLFDMDGVLTANNHFHRQAWKELALELLGLNLSEHDLDTKVDGYTGLAALHTGSNAHDPRLALTIAGLRFQTPHVRR